MIVVAALLQVGVIAMSIYLELNPKIKTGPLGSILLGVLTVVVMSRIGANVEPLEVMATLFACLMLGLVIYAHSVTFPDLFSEPRGTRFESYMPERRRPVRHQTRSIKNERRQPTKLSRDYHVFGGWQ